MALKTLKGLALHDILTEIHLFVHRGKWRGALRWARGESPGFISDAKNRNET